MQSVPYRDLKNITPTMLRKKLTSEDQLLLTANNKPIALLVGLYDEDIQDIMLLVSRLRARMATLSIRNQARKAGMNRTTLKEVNALIKRTRAEQKGGKQVHRS